MLPIAADVHADAYNGIANSVLWFIHTCCTRPRWNRSSTRSSGDSGRPTRRTTGVRRGAGGGGGPGRGGPRAGLPPVPGPRHAPGAAARPADRPLLAHALGAADYFALLPRDIREQLVLGMLGADRLGFLTHRWSAAFSSCVQALDLDVAARMACRGARVVPVRTEMERTWSPDLAGCARPRRRRDFLRERAHRPDVEERMAALREEIGEGRKVIVRVDRTELSKNIVRGLLAYRQLLDDHPEWHERVVHVAFAYPSRQDLAVYRDYTAEVQRLAGEINDHYGTPGWTPVVLHVKDDFARSLAAYRLADVPWSTPSGTG